MPSKPPSLPSLPQNQGRSRAKLSQNAPFSHCMGEVGGGGAWQRCKFFIYFVRDCSSVSLIKEMLSSIFHKKQLWYFRIRMQIKCCVQRFIFNTSDVHILDLNSTYQTLVDGIFRKIYKEQGKHILQ